jgi:hypothetical protein
VSTGFLLQIPKFVRGNTPVDFSANFSFRSSPFIIWRFQLETKRRVCKLRAHRLNALEKYKRLSVSETSSHNSLNCLQKSSTKFQTSKNEIRKFSLLLILSIFTLLLCIDRSSLSLSWPWPSPHLKGIKSPSKLCHPTAKWTPTAATHSSKLILLRS